MENLDQCVMLYKKYHRKFVKQFKKGVKFECINSVRRYIVEKEPFYGGNICITGECSVWVLVYMDGSINNNLLSIIV